MTRRSSWIRLLAVLAVAVLGVAGCGDDDGTDEPTEDVVPETDDTETDDTGTDDTTAEGIDAEGVVISDFTFDVTPVPAGSTVTVVNQDSVPHTATADDGTFDSGRVPGGESGAFTAPTDPGEYAFHCEVHPSITGTLTVQ